MNALNPNATIAQLYYLFIYADGEVDEKEKQYGQYLIEIEQLNGVLFNKELERLENEVIDKNKLLEECVAVLVKLEKRVQLRYIAWMCVIANSDGFMSSEEWKLVYQFYHVKLKIPHDELLTEQTNIKREIGQKIKGVV